MDTLAMPLIDSSDLELDLDGLPITPDNVFTVPLAYLAQLKHEVAKIERRAVKMGVDAPQVTYGPVIRIASPFNDKVTHEAVEVTVGGGLPVFDGWRFGAKILPADGVVMVHKHPAFDTEIPVKYREGHNICEHCNKQRYRTEYFVVHNATTGQFLQVGRQCLQKFIGDDAAHRVMGMFANLWRLLAILDGAQSEPAYAPGGGGGGTAFVERLEWIAQAEACIEADGWTSSAQARNDPNAYSTRSQCVYQFFAKRDKHFVRVPIEQRHFDFAKLAIEWIVNDLSAKANRTDFEHNLLASVTPDDLSPPLWGTAAYATQAYRKHLGMVAERKAKEQAAKATAGGSQHIGAKGERLRGLLVTVTSVTTYDSQWGTTWYHNALDQSGNVIRFRGTRELGKEGDTITITGTVTDHSEWQGTRQTVLNRVAVGK